MEWQARIIVDPNILMGKPVVRGTRLAVSFVLDLFAQGWTSEQVLQNYPQLSKDDLQAVFSYGAARFRDEEIRPFKVS